MNGTIAAALLRDAYAQVVDNKVFRLLLVLLAVMVLPTFLIAAREDELVVLWNWRFPYEQILGIFGGGGGFENAQILLIQGIQSLLVDGIAGTIGILFSVAATAFFLPRMLEKGSADTVFSKPVSRLVLMLSRYFAGLLFVAILAVVLVGGMHLGLLTVSGYSDPGFLWSIPTLIYLFGIVHAVSVLVGVVTKSSVAAILITLVFYVFNGCIHMMWEAKESTATHPGGSDVQVIYTAPGGRIAEAPGTAPADAEGEQEEEKGRALKILVGTLDAMHYVLPKTADAKRIAQKLRRSVEHRKMHFVESQSELTIAELPAGFEPVPGSSLDSAGGLAWAAPHPAGAEQETLRLSRRPLSETSKARRIRELRERLEADAAVSELSVDARTQVGGQSAAHVEWRERRGDETRLRRAWVFQDRGQWLYQLDYDAEAEWASAPDDSRGPDSRQAETADEFVSAIDIGFEDDFAATFHMNSYERRFGWDAAWKYNAFFSIGTTLAFVLLALGLAWWRLARMDF